MLAQAEGGVVSLNIATTHITGGKNVLHDPRHTGGRVAANGQ